MKETERRERTAIRQAVHYRNYRRIRDRALRRLGRLYPEQYRELFEEERAKDEAEGKAWLDISGRTRRSVMDRNAQGRTSDIGSEQTNLHHEQNGDL